MWPTPHGGRGKQADYLLKTLKKVNANVQNVVAHGLRAESTIQASNCRSRAFATIWMQSKPGWPASGVELLVFDYIETDRRAVVSWYPEDKATPWLGIARDVLLSGSKEALQEGGDTISLPWWSFLGLRPAVFDLIRGFKLASGVGYQVSERAADHLRLARSRDEGYALGGRF
ncbi:hypothetical protein RHAB21_04206 [Pseudorhizobium halotolerans]|uniref:Uncharacterized protein n=1 Tax=Pseudorhizobium halotolerans TaxID=1233081 RepID=A0ABN7JVR7_9HYPH|nr:hypothetical protein RHAB21_04206 [Pseudorhizobium halotolerans]